MPEEDPARFREAGGGCVLEVRGYAGCPEGVPLLPGAFPEERGRLLGLWQVLLRAELRGYGCGEVHRDRRLQAVRHGMPEEEDPARFREALVGGLASAGAELIGGTRMS